MMCRIPGLFCVILVFLWLPMAFSQDEPLTPEQRQAAIGKFLPIRTKLSIGFIADGKMFAMTYLHDGDDPTFQALTETTDDQYYAFDKFIIERKDSIRLRFETLLRKVLKAAPEEIAGIETEAKGLFEEIFDANNAKLHEILTPRQIAKIRELELQSASYITPPTTPMINYDAYNALGLSEKQQRELETIRKEFEEEQGRFFEEMLRISPKPGVKPTPEELKIIYKNMSEHGQKGRALANRIRSKIVSLLDKDQEKKLNDLLVNIPEFLKEKKKRFGQAPKPVDEKAYDAWKKSWKPGDPVPQEFREREKSTRRLFP